MMRIGFIGLGAMGAPMARNLSLHGPLTVLDIRAEATAAFVQAVSEAGAADVRRAEDLSEIAAETEIILLSLPGPPQFSEAVLADGGLIHLMRPGSLIIDLTTNNPDLVRTAAAALRDKGIGLVDAPVSGGVSGATAGTLTLMVGGADADVERARPVLARIGSDLVHVGDVGSGGVCKLVHNMIASIIRQGLTEGFTLGVKAGVDPLKLWDCVRNGAVGRGLQIHYSLPQRVFTGTFTPASFAAALSLKDATLAGDLADALGVPTPAADLARAALTQVVERGWGDWDSWSTFLIQEEAAGVRVRASGTPLDR